MAKKLIVAHEVWRMALLWRVDHGTVAALWPWALRMEPIQVLPRVYSASLAPPLRRMPCAYVARQDEWCHGTLSMPRPPHAPHFSLDSPFTASELASGIIYAMCESRALVTYGFRLNIGNVRREAAYVVREAAYVSGSVLV